MSQNWRPVGQLCLFLRHWQLFYRGLPNSSARVRGPPTDALQVPLKPIIIFALFWAALFVFYTYVVEFIFFAVSLVGIYAVLAREAKLLAHFCWVQLLFAIIELIFDFVFVLYFTIGNTTGEKENFNKAL